MKKSLLAIAAMTAFAGAAQAQSSVTVYGIVDVGFSKLEGVNGAVTTAGAPNGQKTVLSSFNSSNLATSRLGFRGVEDIGGGVKASFVAEIGLTPTSNGFSGSTNYRSTPLGTTYANNSAALDNRQSYLGLSKTGLGDARIGRQYTSVHESVCAQNAGQCNAIAGDMIYMGANSSSTITVSNKLDTSYQVRASNAVRFSSENIAGIEMSALYSANNTQVTDSEAATTVTGLGAVNFKMAGANVTYTGIKNLDVRFAAQRTSLNRDNANTPTAGNTLIGGTFVSTTPGVTTIARSNQRDQYAGVSYDFNIAKVSLQNIVLEVEALNALTLKRTATQLAVTAPITSTIAAWASYGKGNYRNASSSTTYNFNGYQAGGTYALSKRTSLYAIYGYAQQDAVTTGQTKYSDTQYAVGAKHTF